MKLQILVLGCFVALTSGLDIDDVLSRAQQSLDEKARAQMVDGAQSRTRTKVTKRQLC